jgi:hypothetical protein
VNERKPKRVSFELGPAVTREEAEQAGADPRILDLMDRMVGDLTSECMCACHHTEGMVHCMPCCYVCPHCKRRISTFYYDRHVEKCKERMGE